MEDECTMCGGETEIIDSGSYNGSVWNHYRCTECGYEESEEPDWDSMPGGHDDY